MPTRSRTTRVTRPATPAAPSRRARNRLDKRQRIRQAARDLFSQHGFEHATLRQIAQRAHVALGTLFNYARDKRDLTFLIFNEELSALVDDAIAASPSAEPLLEQLMSLWRPHYHYFARDPVLSRLLLRDMTFYADGTEADEFHRIRARVLAHLETLVRDARRRGQISPPESPRTLALLLFFVYAGAVRWWIANDRPDPDAGLADLRVALAIQVRALGAAPAARAQAARTRGTRSRTS